MPDAAERPTRRATRRGHTQAPPEAPEGTSVALWRLAPELVAFEARAATRSAPLQDMIILAWRGQWIAED